MLRRITVKQPLYPQLLAKTRRTLRRRGQKIGCLEYSGFCRAGAYPVVYAFGGRMTLHNLVWALRSDTPVPKGYKVCHKCGNPRCMEDTHLVARPANDPYVERVRNRPPGARGFVGLRGEANPNAILNADDVRYIRERCEQGASIWSMAKEYGIAYSLAYYIVKQQIWTHL